MNTQDEIKELIKKMLQDCDDVDAEIERRRQKDVWENRVFWGGMSILIALFAVLLFLMTN